MSWRLAVRAQPWLTAVFIVGILARAVLIPITHGQDFVVWDQASAATLRGVNVFAHHPDYPGGPYAYFPLFLYLELPFQWLAQHTGIPFTVLGKAPILIADTAAAALIAAELAARGRSQRWIAAGTALFFLNPLVLYNGAFYGRFDTLGCALLLLSLYLIRRSGDVTWASALWYALAVAAKTFAIFVIAGLLRRGGAAAWKVLASLVIVLGLLSLPYLGSLHAYLHDIVLYDVRKVPQGLSWQQAFLHVTDEHGARVLSYVLLAVFVIGAAWLSGLGDLATTTLLTLLLFILCSKVVLEQYLIWPMPWLILALAATSRPDRPSVLLLAWFTTVGMLVNPYIHPFGRAPQLIGFLLGASIALYLAVACRRQLAVATETRRSAPSPKLSGTAP